MLSKLRDGLSKTRTSLMGRVKGLFSGRRIDDELLEELEEILIEADMGVETVLHVIDDLREIVKSEGAGSAEDVIAILRSELLSILQPGEHELRPRTGDGPHVILVAGVNGSGKTTTIGKLSARFIDQGHTVLLGAADTFRAAAADQLSIWSERTGAPIVKHKEGADPAAVAYDAADSAVSKNSEYLIIDTAGRLHTKVNLMEELKKIQRVVAKRIPGAPHEVLLVLDATTGQNGLEQARHFSEALHATGIVLTKLDGTAKGGIAIAIQKELGLPIKLVGVGEAKEDLQPFNPQEFVEALLPVESAAT